MSAHFVSHKLPLYVANSAQRHANQHSTLTVQLVSYSQPIRNAIVRDNAQMAFDQIQQLHGRPSLMQRAVSIHKRQQIHATKAFALEAQLFKEGGEACEVLVQAMYSRPDTTMCSSTYHDEG
eukprot:2382-Heterococcus_DN1.PRE.2